MNEPNAAIAEWQVAGRALGEALKKHPSIRYRGRRPHLHYHERAAFLIWQEHDRQVEFRIEDPLRPWWRDMNPRRARQMADELLDGLRQAYREGRWTSAFPGQQPR